MSAGYSPIPKKDDDFTFPAQNGSHGLGHARRPSHSSGLPARFRLSRFTIFLAGIAVVIILIASSGGSTKPKQAQVVPSSRVTPLEWNSKAAVRAYCPLTTSEDDYISTLILKGDQQQKQRQARTIFMTDPRTGEPAPFGVKYNQNHFWIDQKYYGFEGNPIQACGAHLVPSSPRPVVPEEWEDNQIMFGMATTPDRVSFNAPVWKDWIPYAATDEEQAATTAALPLLLVLTPPATTTTELAALDWARLDVSKAGIHAKLKPLKADRFEDRYFMLAREMWKAALVREEEEGIEVEWFVFMDDDTFYPDYALVLRMMHAHDPSEKVFIGAITEAKFTYDMFGVQAYGGAGVFVSRALMAAMNAPGVFEQCQNATKPLFGGDAKLSHCAASVSRPHEPYSLGRWMTVEDSIHQCDIWGDATGWYQSGFHITSMHHWQTWSELFPPWHPHRTASLPLSDSTDRRQDPLLIGKAAKAVGGDNWLRRYVFDDGKAVVHLGYSVVVYKKRLTYEEMGKSEHTFRREGPYYYPNRDPIPEGAAKRSYFLTDVEQIAEGVYRLIHKNSSGERFDLIWDGNAVEGGSGWWKRRLGA